MALPDAICVRCDKVKSRTDEFFRLVRELRHGSSYEYHKRVCRECEYQQRSLLRRRTRERDAASRRIASTYESRRRRNLAKNYGLPLEEYDRMLVAQGGACAICKRAPYERHRSGRILPLTVDHDHVTGAIRRLLCGSCNRGLGDFRDSITNLQNAIEYLRQHHG